MYHVLKIGSAYVGPNGEAVYGRASALHVDAVTVRAFKRSVATGGGCRDCDILRLVTVTTRADRAARHVDSTSDPQSAQ